MKIEKVDNDFEEVRDQINRIEKMVKDSYANKEARVEFYRNVDTLLARYSDSEERVKLNIGGSTFSLTMKSLIVNQDTFFYNLIYNLLLKNFDFNNAIFIDRDPKYFNYIIELLTLPNYVIPKLNQVELSELTKEIEFYNINSIEHNQLLSKASSIVMVKKATIGSTELDVEEFYQPKFEKELVVKKEEHLEIEFEEGEVYNYLSLKGSDGRGASINISNDGKNWTKVTKLTKKLLLGEKLNMIGTKSKYLKIKPVDFVVKLDHLNIFK